MKFPRHEAGGEDLDGTANGRRSLRLLERHVLEEDDVVRPHRHIDVAFHRMRQHLVVDRDVDLLGDELVPDGRDRRVALGGIGLARDALDQLVDSGFE
jgi:hypothetical protein